MKKVYKIALLSLLMGFFGAVSGKIDLKEANKQFYFLAPIVVPGSISLALDYVPNNLMRDGLRKSLARSQSYSTYRALQPVRYFDWNGTKESAKPQCEVNFFKENLNIFVQQGFYIGVDSAVTKVADKASQLDIVKRVAASAPVQYFSEKISQENKALLRDLAITGTSAVVINGIYYLTRNIHYAYTLVSSQGNPNGGFDPMNPQMKQSNNDLKVVDLAMEFGKCSLYENNSDIAKGLVINGIDSFVVKKIISWAQSQCQSHDLHDFSQRLQNLKHISPVFAFAIYDKAAGL